MSDFEQDFESSRLAILAEHYPNIAKPSGQISFFIDDRGRLSGTSWNLDESTQAQTGESGFKTHLLELLETLIQYRKQHGQLQGKHGLVQIGGGKIAIEWLDDEPAAP